MEIELDVSGSFLRVILSGEQSLEDLRSTEAAVRQHADYKPGVNQLWDLRAGCMKKLAGNNIRALLGIWANGQTRGKVALVGDRDIDFGFMRMAEILIDGQAMGQIRAFLEIKEAVGWVSVR